MATTYDTSPKTYATALRTYTPNYFSGGSGTQSGPTGAMSPHLSQPMPLDSSLAQAYREFLTDPQAKQYEQYGVDVDRLWRFSPNSSIFKPDYQHNPYALERAEQIRQLRNPTPEQQSDPRPYILDENGEMMRNPAFVIRERDGSD